MILPIKASLANRTVMQIFTGMKLEVNVVVPLIDKLFIARWADVSVFRQMPCPVKRHCVVALELLLTDGTWKLLIGILVLLEVSSESIFFKTGKIAVRIRTFEWFFCPMCPGHVTYLRGSVDENSVAFVTRPDLICVEQACVLLQALLVLKYFAADCANGLVPER